MTQIKRPCIERGCVNYAVPGKSRCVDHEKRFQSARVTPSQKVAQTSRWRKLRAKVIRERRRADGTWRCEICGQTITDQREIDCDHIEPVYVSEARAYDPTNVRVSHRHCNRSRPRPRSPKPGSSEWWAARDGRGGR